MGVLDAILGKLGDSVLFVVEVVLDFGGNFLAVWPGSAGKFGE